MKKNTHAIHYNITYTITHFLLKNEEKSINVMLIYILIYMFCLTGLLHFLHSLCDLSFQSLCFIRRHGCCYRDHCRTE